MSFTIFNLSVLTSRARINLIYSFSVIDLIFNYEYQYEH